MTKTTTTPEYSPAGKALDIAERIGHLLYRLPELERGEVEEIVIPDDLMEVVLVILNQNPPKTIFLVGNSLHYDKYLENLTELPTELEVYEDMDDDDISLYYRDAVQLGTSQEAAELFEKGWRLQNWGAFLTDTSEEIQLVGPNGQHGYWADGAGQNTDEAFEIIGVENSERGEDILFHLSNLTGEIRWDELAKERTVIVAHGDFDGIVSAVRLAEELDISAEKAKVIFTQPFLVDKVEIPDNIMRVYVVDIAVNNRDPGMTMKFIESLGDRLRKWYDHHEGWSEEMRRKPKFEIDSSLKACAQFFEHYPDDPNAIAMGDPLVTDAVVADTRQGELSVNAQLVEHACKADIRNDEIRVAAVKWFLGDWSQREILEIAAEKYAEIQKETERLVATYEVDSNVAVVDARSTPAESFDLTQLLLAGQKIVTFATAIHTDSRTSEKMVTVATQWKGVNLMEIFGLPSGAPFRITLPVSRLEEIKKTLRGFRPCTCGSNEPWTTCQAGSPHCG